MSVCVCLCLMCRRYDDVQWAASHDPVIWSVWFACSDDTCSNELVQRLEPKCFSFV